MCAIGPAWVDWAPTGWISWLAGFLFVRVLLCGGMALLHDAGKHPLRATLVMFGAYWLAEFVGTGGLPW